MNENKLWVSIPEYEGIYSISNTGAIKSVRRVIVTCLGRSRTIPERILMPKSNGVGYQFVTLCKGGNRKNYYVHRLLAQAFIPNPDSKRFVNHIDGNSLNNSLDNLEHVTHPENTKHAYDKGLNSNKGSKHSFSIGVIDNMLGKEFSTIKDWCKARGLNYSTGRNIISGSNKTKVIDLSQIELIKKQKNGKR